jgi:transcriptional regulator with XRE-family HTH domain
MESTTQTNIKTLRARGWSQSRISRVTGIPQPRLSRWESGDVPDAADDALRLAALVSQLTDGLPPEVVQSREPQP